MIGDDTTIGRGADIRPAVKLWPNKQIDEGAVVTSSLVYGSQARRMLFGSRGIAGLAKPEFAAQIGAALGSVLDSGDTVVVNCDVSPPARMVKRAVMAGLTSAGMAVLDMGALPIGAAGFRTIQEDAAAGVHVRLSSHQYGAVEILMLGPDGLDLAPRLQRSIETVMAREDFRRASPEEIGQINVVDVSTGYVEGLTRQVKLEPMRETPFSIVIDYTGGMSLNVLPPVLARAGIQHVAMSGSHTGLDAWRSDEEVAEEVGRLSSITASIGANIGLRLDMDGGRIWAVDEIGQPVSEIDLAGVVLTLIASGEPGATAFPVISTASSWSPCGC